MSSSTAVIEVLKNSRFTSRFMLSSRCKIPALPKPLRPGYEHRAAATQDFGLRSSIINELPCVRTGHQTTPGLMERLRQWYTTESSSEMVMKATDPRDFVFSLFGISCDAAELDLKPDYSKSHHAVLIETATAIISSGTLEILTLAKGSNKSLPSWVPDWSSEIGHNLQHGPWSTSLGISDNFFSLDTPRPSLDLRPYMACRGIKQNSQVITASGDGLSLSISVILLDSVEHIFGSGIIYKSINDDLLQLWDELYTAARTTGSSELPYHNLGDAVFRLLTLDRERVDSRGLWNICRAREEFLSSAQKVFMLWRDTYSRNPPLEFWDTLKKDVILDLFTLTSRTVNVGRRPFVTKQGWLGMGLERMIEGDIVAIIAGADVPFILRADEHGHHRLIAEAYFQGLMDGEAAEMGLPVLDIDLY